jgi:hypothetical protein
MSDPNVSRKTKLPTGLDAKQAERQKLAVFLRRLKTD